MSRFAMSKFATREDREKAILAALSAAERDAARWRGWCSRVYAEPMGGGLVAYRYPTLFGGPEILKGSVAQHFTAAVDAKWPQPPLSDCGGSNG